MHKCSNCFLVRSSAIFLILVTLICFPAVACSETEAQPPAVIHGPICVWHHRPQSECSLVWIEQPASPQMVWFEAEAGFGYGDGDDTTILEMAGKHRDVYIRYKFEVANLSQVEGLNLEILYDDGFVAFLNGHEVARSGVVGDIGKTKVSKLDVENHEAKEFEAFAIEDGKRWLQKGENILAIVGLNVKKGSSDFTLHPALVCQVDGEKTALVERNETWQVFHGAAPASDWMTSYNKVAELEPDKEDSPWTLEMRYCVAGGDDWKSTSIERRPMADSGSAVATVLLKELEPETEYQIELEGLLDGKSVLRRTLSMKTAPKQRPRKFNFVNGGDMFHTRELLDAMNRRAGRLDPMFALLGGDLAYANARDAGRWYQWFDSWYENAVTEDGRQIPMIAVIGNHETLGLSPHHAKFYYSLFPLPEGRSNFVVDFGDYMSIVNLDSEHSQPVANQTQWLEDTLEQRKKTPLLFACYHRPTFGTLVKEDNSAVRTQWVPLFEKYKVDTVFEHDHHVYKRSLPILNGRADNRHGVLYLGDGAWGVKVREIPEQ